VAAEAPDAEWVDRLGSAPDIYSPDINYWVFEAALQLITSDPDITVLYCHTTDYPMHMNDHTGEISQRHLAEIDRCLGRIADACPDLELYLTADHGMNFKRRCYDLNRLLPEKGCPIYFAMSAEPDPYVKHHRAFGGSAYMWLSGSEDFLRVVEALRRVEGIEEVYGRAEAAARFHLHPIESATSWCWATATRSLDRSIARSKTFRRRSARTARATRPTCRCLSTGPASITPGGTSTPTTSICSAWAARWSDSRSPTRNRDRRVGSGGRACGRSPPPPHPSRRRRRHSISRRRVGRSHARKRRPVDPAGPRSA
jgi:Type I phosphodiesterase / nucleotide pyrophosphatase